MFLLYVLSFFKTGDTIQGGHYSREDIIQGNTVYWHFCVCQSKNLYLLENIQKSSKLSIKTVKCCSWFRLYSWTLQWSGVWVYLPWWSEMAGRSLWWTNMQRRLFTWLLSKSTTMHVSMVQGPRHSMYTYQHDYGYFKTFWDINFYGDFCLKVTWFKGFLLLFWNGGGWVLRN